MAKNLNNSRTPSLNIAGVMRSAFLSFQFPILPYCQVGRGPSTKFNESFHIENRDKKITLNFWWNSDNTVCVSTYNSKEPNPFKKNESILNRTKSISQDEIVKLCERFLS